MATLHSAGMQCDEVAMRAYDYVWRWRCRLPERKGQRCRILTRARRMNSIAVEFESDGLRVCTSRYAVRRAGPRRQLGLFDAQREAERCATWGEGLP